MGPENASALLVLDDRIGEIFQEIKTPYWTSQLASSDGKRVMTYGYPHGLRFYDVR
jgi:hypothetical protein